MTKKAVDPNTLLSENDLLRWVLDLAPRYQILAYHARPAQVGKEGRWVTAQDGDTGFPDLVLAGRRGVVFAELKTEKGRVGLNQKAWIDRLAKSGQRVYVWRPSNRDEILDVMGEIR